MQLVKTQTISTYRVGCPHCRSTIEHSKEAEVTITTDEHGKIIALRVDCDWARQAGQDRT